MNDHELDQLLDSWQAPPPSRSLRDGLITRFPRRERRRFAHPLRWVLAVAAASLTLAVGMEQTGVSPWDFRIGRALSDLFPHFFKAFELHRAAYLAGKIRNSEPRLFIDGAPSESLTFQPAGRLDFEIPGDGVYSVIVVPGLKGWTEAGKIHDNVIELQAGRANVRIECNTRLVDSERPVFLWRRP